MEETTLGIYGRFPFAPALKLPSRETYAAALNSGALFIVVRLQDLLAKGGKAFKPLFYQIKEAGGLHAQLKHSGKILLSLVMHNRILRHCSPEMCAEAIDALRPDFSTTMDCESYLDRQISAKLDCEWCMERNRQLLKLCPEHKFVGLVKGASERQVQKYLDDLKDLGMTDFALNVGDYVFRGKKKARNSAIHYARMIRAQCGNFFLYGISAVSLIHRFPRADAYVVQTHYMTAFKRQKRIGGKWKRVPEKGDAALITHNLAELWKEADEASNPKRGLMQWVTDTPVAVSPTQESGTGSADRKRTATSL